MQGSKVVDSLNNCLAYQTPPYDVKKQFEPSLSPVARTSSSNSSEILVVQIAKYISGLSVKHYVENKNNDPNALYRFLKEVLKRSKCNKKAVLLSTVYFQRVKKLSKDETSLPEFAKCSKRVFLSCLILAHKFLYDNTFSLKTWSLISGLNQKDLCYMECWCLRKLDYRLLVADAELGDLQYSISQCTKKRPLEEDYDTTQRKVAKYVVLVN